MTCWLALRGGGKFEFQNAIEAELRENEALRRMKIGLEEDGEEKKSYGNVSLKRQLY